MVTKTRKILANNILYFRIKNNWSQEKLAETLGTSSAYVSEMENAKRNISCDYMDNLCSIFNVEPQELLIERRQINKRRFDRQ